MIILLFLPFSLLAQHSNYYDSLKAELKKNMNDSARFQVLLALGLDYSVNTPDSAVHYAQEVIRFTAKNKDNLPVWTEWNGNFVLGIALWSAGNFPDAKECFFKQLKQSEAIKDTFGIFKAYLNLGGLNRLEGNYKDAIHYYKKNLLLNLDFKGDNWLADYFGVISGLSNAYEQTDILDSALFYTQLGQQVALKNYGKKTSPFWGCLFGPIYSKMGQPSLALEYFRSYLKAIEKHPEDIASKISCFYEMAKHFERNNRNDSAIYYAKQAFQLSRKHAFKISILHTSRLLSKLYQSENKIDSAFKYQNIMVKTEEDMFSKEKISRMNMLEFNEQIRQKELELTLQHQEHERNHRLQLTVLAISIIIVIIIFLLLSRSIIVSQKFIEFLGVIVLLITFEFIDQVLHPVIAKITNDTPVLMLLILVFIAGLLIPLHTKLEKWTIKKLVEKNKKIRLAAAKKTIEQLEKDQMNE